MIMIEFVKTKIANDEHKRVTWKIWVQHNNKIIESYPDNKKSGALQTKVYH